MSAYNVYKIELLFEQIIFAYTKIFRKLTSDKNSYKIFYAILYYPINFNQIFLSVYKI